jgi:hypothetical protein
MTTKTPLINRSRVKTLALETAARSRAHKFTRVSEDLLVDAEAELRGWVARRVASHPSVGKTLR